ncbi:MAG: hypothetical protein ABI760_13335 [Ferruginibacter sp.]
MKKAIIVFVCLGIINYSFAQETPSETAKPSLTKEDYLKKSKGQKTGAIVLVSVGGAMAIGGIAWLANEFTQDVVDVVNPYPANNSNSGKVFSAVLIVAGVAAILGGVKLFKSSHKNKQRALSMSLNNELVPQLQRSLVFNRYIPSLTLKVKL